MDDFIVDTIATVLSGTLVEETQVKDALLACLDLTSPDDSDACALREMIQRDRDEQLLEFHAAFTRLRERTRWPRGTGRIPRVHR